MKKFFSNIKSWPVWGKFLAAVAVLILPIALISLIFTPLIHQRATFNSDKRYQLTADFSENDLNRIVNVMAEDMEFEFYFKALSPATRQQDIKDFLAEMKGNHTQEALVGYLNSKQKKIESLAVLINTLHFADDFTQSPDRYPELGMTLMNFISAEFELTLAGLCYKVLYDPQFQFQWTPVSRRAASLTVRLFNQLSLSQRLQLQQILDTPAIQAIP